MPSLNDLICPHDNNCRGARALAVTITGLLVIGILVQGAERLRLTLSRASSPPVALSQNLDALVTQAESEGKNVRVMVGLNIPFQPEGNLDSSQVEQQRAGIRSMQQKVKDALRSTSYIIVYEYESIPYLAMEVDQRAYNILKQLQGIVARIEEDKKYKTQLDTSRPIIGAQVYEQFYNGAGAVVAIIDNGVETNHAFFRGKVLAEACFGNDCSRGSEGAGGSGVADPNCSNVTSNDQYMCAHGTYVAGIIAGDGRIAPEIDDKYIGIAPGAMILAVKVGSKNCTAPDGKCYLDMSGSDLAAGMEWVNQQKSKYLIGSVNISLASATLFGDVRQTYCDLEATALALPLNNLRSSGIIPVAATGNSGKFDGIASPACISTVVPVASTNDDDSVSSFSNVGQFDNLMYAPGNDIATSTISNAMVGGVGGTSVAAPHVAAAFAILRAAFPSATAQNLIDALRQTGVSVTDSRPGATGTLVKPRILINKALEYLRGAGVTSSSAGLSGTTVAWIHKPGSSSTSGAGAGATSVAVVQPSASPQAAVTVAKTSDARVTLVSGITKDNKGYVRADITGVDATKVDWFVNDTLYGSDNQSPFYLGGESVSLPASVPKGTYNIKARVYTGSTYFDAVGQLTI